MTSSILLEENSGKMHETDPTVVMCYKLLSIAQLDSDGTLDYTDGKYNGIYGGDRESYLRAQMEQAKYLLDEVRCVAGSSLLDVGCGHGRLLRTAQERNARALGITISPEQVRYCSARGLSARLLDYRNMPDEWKHKFTCIVANGSLEHFVQVRDARRGKTDEIYRRMFEIFRSLLHSGDRLATTAIHFRDVGQVDPQDIFRGPSAFPRGSDEYHFAMIAKTFGGWYPCHGQLERCSQGYFVLVRDEDGTQDYCETSEYWLRSWLHGLCLNPHALWFMLRNLFLDYRTTHDMIRCLLIDQSWAWQFRGENPPTRLYRHTWEAV